VFAWKGETLDQYWWTTFQTVCWPGADGPDLIVDDGGDATLLVHEGVKWEKEFKDSGKLPDPKSTDDAEFSIVLRLIKNSIAKVR